MHRVKKIIFIPVLLFSMMLSIFIQDNNHATIEAKSLQNVVDSLELIGKKEEYFPGEVIYLQGHWKLEDDKPGLEIKAGDQFEVSIPHGFTPLMKTIKLGDMGEGVWNGTSFVFTFTENVEQLIGREGGFNIGLQLDPPAEDGKIPQDLTVKDGNGNPLLKETIMIDNEAREGVDPEDIDEALYKNSFPGFTENGVKWYIRVNRSHDLKDDVVTVVDRLQKDHRIIPETFKISVNKEDNLGSGTEFIKEIPKPIFDEDLMGYHIELDLQGGDIWYDIQYESEYTGEDFNEEEILLENDVVAYGNNIGRMSNESPNENGFAEAKFNLGGWARGTGTKGNVRILKKDFDHDRLLEGAEFKLEHIKNGYSYTGTTDKDGAILFENVADGVYRLSEVKAPLNYQAGEEKIINVRFNQANNFVFEETVYNTREKTSLKGKKIWFTENGEKMSSQSDVVLQLYGDGELKRQMVLSKGQTDFEFKNIPTINHLGEEVEFEIKEIIPEEFYNHIYLDENTSLYMIENHEKPKPEEPPVETPEEPPVETPEEPPVETPEEPPVETPEEPPVETPEEPPVETPEEPPVETPEEPPVETPEEPPVEIQEDLPQTGMNLNFPLQLGMSTGLLGLLVYLKSRLKQ